MHRPLLHRALIPPVVLLILSLGLGSQYLFHAIPATALPPGPLPLRSALIIDLFLACILTSYLRACFTHPGPLDPPSHPADDPPNRRLVAALRRRYPATRWCWKCRAPKPPRAHHCSVCRQCVPRMDHHCPWIGNCVGMTTFPHFLRFLCWATVGLWVLCGHVWTRLRFLFADSRLPAYLGPSRRALAAFLVLGATCALTTLFLTLMFAMTAWDWVRNQTTVEDKEMRTYEAILERRNGSGTWWADSVHRSHSSDDDDDDNDNPITTATTTKKKPTPMDPPIEFPYEIGFFKNMAQSMGTSNPLLWLWPLAPTPALDPDGFGSGVGWRWEENGFNDREGMWPPREVRRARGGGNQKPRGGWPGSEANRAREEEQTRSLNPQYPQYSQYPPSSTPSAEIEKATFRARQLADRERMAAMAVVRRRLEQERERGEIVRELEEDGGGNDNYNDDDDDDDDDDDIPLAELARRRKVA